MPSIVMVNRVIRPGSCEKNDIYLKWFAVEIAPGNYKLEEIDLKTKFNHCPVNDL